LTKIIHTGEHYSHHSVGPLPAGYGAGWWIVENKIANVITDTQGLRFDVTTLQATSETTNVADAAAATAEATAATGGLGAAGTATGAAGTAIAGGDWGTVALGAAGGALFTVSGYAGSRMKHVERPLCCKFLQWLRAELLSGSTARGPRGLGL
jgi:hypothetical protein